MYAVLLAGILQGVERPRSVYSITPQWLHGVTVCASKFPPTVSKHRPHQHSATHKTMQQYETPTIPAVVISKVLLPQFNIMAPFVRSHRCLFSDVSSGLQTYRNQCHSF